MVSLLDIGLTSGLVYAWIVLALAVAFRLLDFPDLTIEGSVPLGAGAYAAIVALDASPLAAIAGGVLAGAAAGALTGWIHSRLRLNKFLAGILVVAICYSGGLRIMGASNVGLIRFSTIFDRLGEWDRSFGTSFHVATATFLGLLVLLGITALAAALSSRWGLRMRVAGTNPEYAEGLGLVPGRYLIVGLAATNGLAALGGILLSTRQGFSDIGMGQGLLILALASLTIGERLFPQRLFPIHLYVLCASVLGAVAFQVLAALALRAGLAGADVKLATALIVLLVVGLRWSSDSGLFEVPR